MDIMGRRFMLITPGSQRVNCLIKSIHVHLCISSYSNFTNVKNVSDCSGYGEAGASDVKDSIPTSPTGYR